jgi:hypothetical protein
LVASEEVIAGKDSESTNELKRAGVLARGGGDVDAAGGGDQMAVSTDSWRGWRYRQQGASGVRHGNAGRRSNRATAARIRTRVLALVRAKYGGGVDERFGPTLAAEHLATEDGITVDHETLRRWMLAAGLWSRARKRSPHRRRRERKAHFGELVQLDGSFHPWFEARGPVSCLLTLVDDATGRSLGRFGPQETIWAAVGILRAWIDRFGIPHALYTDWKNVYVRVPNAEERATGAVPLTQFGRMCAALGITIIPASSPQAKGRIERNHGTHQDRLVKKLRRLGVADVATANRFLKRQYWADHNRRFAQSPVSPDDFHVAVPRGVRLDQVFRLEETRSVANDWVVRYDNRLLQLERQSYLAPARSKVLVYEDPAGQIEIRYRDRVMRWTEVPHGARAQPPAPRESAPPTDRSDRPVRGRADGDHPWRHAIEDHRVALRLAKERRAWLAVQP